MPAPRPRLPAGDDDDAGLTAHRWFLLDDLAPGHGDLVDETDAAGARAAGQIGAGLPDGRLTASWSASGTATTSSGHDLPGHRVGPAEDPGDADAATALTRSSIGSGCTFTPPTLMISEERPRKWMRSPSSSTRSPVGAPAVGVDRRLAVVAEHAGARADPQLAVDDLHRDVGVVAAVEHLGREAGPAVAHRPRGAELGRGVDLGDAGVGERLLEVAEQRARDRLAAQRDLLAAPAPGRRRSASRRARTARTSGWRWRGSRRARASRAAPRAVGAGRERRASRRPRRRGAGSAGRRTGGSRRPAATAARAPA